MNDITAAIGLGQLERIEEIVSKRKKIGKMFLDATAGFDWFIVRLRHYSCSPPGSFGSRTTR